MLSSQEKQLSDKTMCMVGTSGQYHEYRHHNVYGLSESEATILALQQVTNNKRSQLVARSAQK